MEKLLWEILIERDKCLNGKEKTIKKARVWNLEEYDVANIDVQRFQAIVQTHHGYWCRKGR